MKPAPRPAEPDLMTLLCLIGTAVRALGSSSLVTKLLLIAVIRPQFGFLLRTWLAMEERFADLDMANEADGSGWISQEGPVWRWAHVTGHGSVLVIPFRWFVEYCRAEWLKRRRVWSPCWSLALPCASLFFLPVLAATRNCVPIVPVS